MAQGLIQNGAKSAGQSCYSHRRISRFAAPHLWNKELRCDILTFKSAGIGAGIAIELAKRGASVAITYVSSRLGAESTLEFIEKLGYPKGLAIQADCAKAELSAMHIVSSTTQHFSGSGVDIIINNAADGSDHTIDEVTRDNFDAMFHTNVLFPLLLIKECTAHLNRNARIVNISSSGARAGE